MFNIQGFYKIKTINNSKQYKEKLKKYLLSKSVKGTVFYLQKELTVQLPAKNQM